MSLGRRTIRFAGRRLLGKDLSPDDREKFMLLLEKVYRLQADSAFKKALGERVNIKELMLWIEAYPEGGEMEV